MLGEGDNGLGDLAQASSFYAGDISTIINYREDDNGAGPSPEPEERERLVENLQMSRRVAITTTKRKGRELSNDDPSESSDPSKRLKVSHSSDVNLALSESNDSNAVYLIVHCPRIQALMDKVKLPRGARFELARLVSTNKIATKDLTEEKIAAIKGSNAEALEHIGRVFLNAQQNTDTPPMDRGFAKEMAVNSPWSELDTEEEAMSKGPYEGLGNNPSYPGWYGGKVQFRAHLTEADKNDPKNVKLILDKCSIGSSCRFTRRFGSWSFIRVKIPSTLYFSRKFRLDTFFRKAFVIWGRVFRACYAKGDNIFLFLTNETFPFSATIKDGMSLEVFINWHNPLAENTEQLMTKWASRMVLGFSTSVPGPLIEQDCILEEGDVLSPKTSSDMTDGCGLSSRPVHSFILEMLGLIVLPSAFQFRLSGYKGMSLLREDAEYGEGGKKVWVRPSQTKIRYGAKLLDPAMLTIDLLRTPHMRPGTRLSNDVIINLAENGVPHEIFVDLLKASLENLVTGLTTWEGPDAMFELWSNVERAGGVIAGRRAREARGEARVRGYSNFTLEELEQEPDDDDEDGLSTGQKEEPRSLAWWRDAISGCPSTLEETVMELVDSGYHPQHAPILREKLKQVVATKIENWTSSLRFDIAQACSGFAVPDPYGCLGPDEIQVKSSSRNLRLDDGSLTDIILGTVLVGRNPCKSPCDIRKLNAVERHPLRNLVDVIVFSIQGYRRLIDFLAGGDYDGDTVFVIWQLSIVVAFQNADETLYGNEPRGVDECFVRDTESVGDFLERTRSMEPAQRVDAMQTYLLGGLADPSLIGKYSSMHDNSIYSRGYAAYKTRKLAAKFCRVLDAPKTGWRIREGTFEDDRRQYHNTEGPEWKVLAKGKKKNGAKNAKPSGESNLPYTHRDVDKLGKFVMDTLRFAAKQEKRRLLSEMDKIFEPLPRRLDPHLSEPWLAAQKWAKRGTPECVAMKEADLQQIATHVGTAYDKHKEVKGHQQGKSFTTFRIEDRQDMLRERSREFHSSPSLEGLPSIPDEETLNRYRASYAYIYDTQHSYNGWSRFPWDVAMGQLCSIKAAALGPYKVVTRDFYERYRMIRKN